MSSLKKPAWGRTSMDGECKRTACKHREGNELEQSVMRLTLYVSLACQRHWKVWYRFVQEQNLSGMMWNELRKWKVSSGSVLWIDLKVNGRKVIGATAGK